MATTLLALGFNAGAVGAGSAAPGAAGKAADEVPAWEKAETERRIATAMALTNLSFMGFGVTPWILLSFSNLAFRTYASSTCHFCIPAMYVASDRSHSRSQIADVSAAHDRPLWCG